MGTILSSNMNLPVPVVGQEPGPTYAFDVNSCFTLLDAHDHTPGYGVQITPAAIDINTSLSFQSNFATNLAGLTLVAQSSTPANQSVYVSGTDLYFTDGLGNNVRITQSGGVAGSPGSISNLTSPASANYVAGSSTFVWQSDTNIAANMDFGSAIMRNLSPNSTYALTLSPPASLSSNYTLVLPPLPNAQKFMTLDASGNITAPWSVDGTTTQISSNQLKAVASGLVDGITLQSSSNIMSVRNGDREHAWELNGSYSGLTFPATDLDSIFIAPYNITITAVWIYSGTAGSSGTTEYDLKLGTSAGSFATMLSTTGKITSAAASNIWTDSNSVIGAQTGVTKPVLSTVAVPAGSAVRFDMIQSMGGTPADARIRIIYKQT